MIKNPRISLRDLAHCDDCPLTPSDDDPLVLLLVEVALHSDNMVYGAVPDLPDAGYPFGVTTHTHIAFPVLIEESL